MAKTKTAVSAEILRPYVQRALTDPDFREDMLAAVAAARGLYGQIATKPGVKGKAKGVVSDEDFQAQLRELVAELSVAGDRLKGKAPKKAKKSHKKRRILLLAGVVLGTLYNPWTGQQTRDWISSQVTGDDSFEDIPDEAPIVEGVATTNGGPDAGDDA